MLDLPLLAQAPECSRHTQQRNSRSHGPATLSSESGGSRSWPAPGDEAVCCRRPNAHTPRPTRRTSTPAAPAISLHHSQPAFTLDPKPSHPGTACQPIQKYHSASTLTLIPTRVSGKHGQIVSPPSPPPAPHILYSPSFLQLARFAFRSFISSVDRALQSVGRDLPRVGKGI